MQTSTPYRIAPHRLRLIPRPLRRWTTNKISLACGGALGVLCGALIAVLGINGLYLCLSLVCAGLILFDFRIGVVLLILLMPISGSYLFPHAMLGITGLNPLNLLLAATLGSYLLQALFDGNVRSIVPSPLLWLYIAPLLLAAVLGARHVDDIVPGFYNYELVSFNDAAGYLRDMFVKPLLLVVFALLVAAAVARSRRPERFLIPTFLSVWVMGLMVIGFVVLSGGSLDQLALSSSRDFLSPLGMHANDLGRLYAVTYALLLFTWARTQSGTARLLLVASGAMVVAATLLTFSRAAFASLMLVNVLYLVHHRNTRALLALAFLALLGIIALPDAVYERMSAGFGSGLNAITAGRLDGLWLPLLPEVMGSPLFGSGLSSILWSETMRTAGGTSVLAVTHPHNAYLEALLDFGLIGLAVLGAFYLHIHRGFTGLGRAERLPPAVRGFNEGAAAGLLSLLLSGLVGGSLAPRPEQAFLWLAIGFMYGLYGSGNTVNTTGTIATGTQR